MSDEANANYDSVVITNIEILTHLGRITTRWAFLEATAEDVLAGFLETQPHYLYPITAYVQMGNRLECLQSLGNLRLDKDRDLPGFTDIINFLKSITSYRNFLIHSLWSPTDDPNIAEVRDPKFDKKAVKKALKRDDRRVLAHTQFTTPDYLDWLVDQIELAAARLFQFGKDYGLVTVAPEGA